MFLIQEIENFIMNIDKFASEISFRFLKPGLIVPVRVYGKIFDFLNKYDLSLECFNTKFPCEDKEIKTEFFELIKIPKMSTLANGAIINRIVKQLPKDQAFVNVGVWNGFTFLAGMLNNPEKICIGIDNFSEFGGPRDQFLARFNNMKSDNHFFYDMDYEKYFSEIHNKKIGFYIYDGSHTYENQLKGLQITEPYLAEDAIIMVDDTNEVEPRQATNDFMNTSKYRWETILDRRTCCNSHPTFWNGIMLIRRGDAK